MAKRWVHSSALVLGAVGILALWQAVQPRPEAAETPAPQAVGSASGAPGTVVDLQPSRQTTSTKIRGVGGQEGLATLINLNPAFNAWYVLQVSWRGAPAHRYHLENSMPQVQRLRLDEAYPQGLVIDGKVEKYRCDLWGSTSPGSLEKASGSQAPYIPLCEGRLYLRHPTTGHQTRIERATDFLRDKVPGGEKIVGLIRDNVFASLYERRAETESESTQGAGQPQAPTGPGPAAAWVNPGRADRVARPSRLGIEIEGAEAGMALGAWYAAKDAPGIYVSVVAPGGIAPAILQSYRNLVGNLDGPDAAGLVYLVAFDLEQFGLRYALGTDHPRVGWSDHLLEQMKDKSLAGPDGIASIAPLVSTGLINPMDAPSAVAAFTAGFKRTHGAFKYGPLALKNHGSHYGFIEQGTVFSRLQPGLATLYVRDDGRVEMTTWGEADSALLPRIRYARQNGVAIIEGFDAVRQMSVPGALVSRWGDGNWSGSSERRLRTLRAGAAVQEMNGKRFLLYAFFWSATPSTMARVFQAYRCRYAMLLDMNALEHTYLALYARQGSGLRVEHLIQEMRDLDLVVQGRYTPRFLGYADDRDFFYLVRKETP